MTLGSPFYFVMLWLLMILTGLFFCLLRRRSLQYQRKIILLIMIVNFIQHFFKFLIYPPYFKMGFTIYSTAYNMCSVLIIFGPVIFLLNRRFLNNFLFFVGSAAGFGAIVYPFWFFGNPVNALGWEYVRFYICHALLFVTSVLPLILGLHKPSKKEFWHVGAGFLLALCVIVINDAIFMSIGLFPGGQGKDLYSQMLISNPCMLMGPKEGFAWISNVFQKLSFPVFLGENPSGRYAPILWYALPVFLGISLGAIALFALIDRKSADS